MIEDYLITLETLQDYLAKLHVQSQHGCGNGGCCIKKPTGMQTNACCRCHPKRVSADLRRLADAIDLAGMTWRHNKV